ncbi:MAG: hypothetical protein A2Z18_01715 [Armatimonadetes bacterium RBG_16_58_9]|nr:MAG: hypothetical protein A2Z18_01715 [Armatimonadetes bacterium RBG_16_58_9]
MSTTDRNNILFETVAIVGVGLIGGSLGMAVKTRSMAGRVIGIGRTEQKLMRAKILGAIDEYSLDFENGAAEADLVVICTPVRLIVPALEKMARSLKAGCIVTDVGSTKQEVVSGASRFVRDEISFVGGHPMAGSEQAGVDAAYPDLFLGATYVLTPGDNTDLEALGKMAALVEGLGANVEIMTPEEHDRSAAVISHLPHAMASALLQLAEDSHRANGKTFRLAAGSFRDLTRVSESDPALWRDICLTNAGALSSAIGDFADILRGFQQALGAGDEEAIERFFEKACSIRNAYLRITK